MRQVELMTERSIIPVRVVELVVDSMEVVTRATYDRYSSDRYQIFVWMAWSKALNFFFFQCRMTCFLFIANLDHLSELFHCTTALKSLQQGWPVGRMRWAFALGHALLKQLCKVGGSLPNRCFCCVVSDKGNKNLVPGRTSKLSDHWC